VRARLSDVEKVGRRTMFAVYAARIDAGATVLVQGAGGGVATALILLGRAAASSSAAPPAVTSRRTCHRGYG
jgi:NADPH:quinone reductase-like Zn-dependent oxidoreductase